MTITNISIGKENRYLGQKRVTTSNMFIDKDKNEYNFQALTLADLVEIHKMVYNIIMMEEQ